MEPNPYQAPNAELDVEPDIVAEAEPAEPRFGIGPIGKLVVVLTAVYFVYGLLPVVWEVMPRDSTHVLGFIYFVCVFVAVTGCGYAWAGHSGIARWLLLPPLVAVSLVFGSREFVLFFPSFFSFHVSFGTSDVREATETGVNLVPLALLFVLLLFLRSNTTEELQVDYRIGRTSAPTGSIDPPNPPAESAEPIVSLTTRAAAEIRKTLQETGRSSKTPIRIIPDRQDSAKCRVQFAAAEPNDGRIVGRTQGLVILIDEKDLAALSGIAIDFQNEEFVIIKNVHV